MYIGFKGETMKKTIILVCVLLTVGFVLLGAQEKRIYNDGEIDYVPAGVKIRLFGEDAGSSLERIEYMINDGKIQQYNGPIQLTGGEGRYAISYRAVDKLGNISKEKIYSCIVDDTPPYFTASANGPAFIENGVAYGTSNTAIVLWAEDELSGVGNIYVSLDNSGFMKYTGSAYIEEEGKHTGVAYAVDNVGNRTKTYSYQAYIDNTPPKVTIKPDTPFIELQGDKYSSAANKYAVSAYDNIAGVKEILVSVDRGEYFTYTEPISVQEHGFHSIRAKAADYLGNMSKASEVGFYVDVETPKTDIEITVD